MQFTDNNPSITKPLGCAWQIGAACGEGAVASTRGTRPPCLAQLPRAPADLPGQAGVGSLPLFRPACRRL